LRLRDNNGRIPHDLLGKTFRKKNFRFVGESGELSVLIPSSELNEVGCIATKDWRLAQSLISAEEVGARAQPSRPAPWVRESAIVYNSPSVLVVLKPNGVSSQQSSFSDFTSIQANLSSISELAAQISGVPIASPLRMVHRLDTPVSGLLLLARTISAARSISYGLRERTGGVKKGYIGLLVSRKPLETREKTDNGEITSLVRTRGVKSTDTPEEKSGTSKYKILSRGERSSSDGLTYATVVAFQPVTGRRHQLRQHACALFGTGFYGDVRYGGMQSNTRDAICLHSGALLLKEESGVLKLIESPPPAWWGRVLREHGLSPGPLHARFLSWLKEE